MISEDIAFMGVFVMLFMAFLYFCKIDIDHRDKGESESEGEEN